MASKDFNKAFAAARKELGAGKTFTFKGQPYSTNFAEEDKPKGFSVEMAKKAIDKAVGPKPVKRPAVATSKDASMQTSPRPPKKPTELMPVSKGIKPADITTTKLAAPKNAATTKVAGRGGFASGPAAGMPAKKKEDAKTSLALPLGAAAAAATAAKVASSKLKGRGAGTPTGAKAKFLSETKPAVKPTVTTPKPTVATSKPTNPREERISREIKVRNETTARAAKANAAADEVIKGKAANVARVKAEAAARSAAARDKVDNSYAKRAESAKAARADAAERLKIQRNFASATRPKVGGGSVRGGSMDLTRGVGTGGTGGISNAAMERAMNPLNLAKGGMVTKKKK